MKSALFSVLELNRDYLNVGTETLEVYRFHGSKGILEMAEFSLNFGPIATLSRTPGIPGNLSHSCYSRAP